MSKHVLLVLVDDLNLAIGCYGHPAAHTPNIDRLAAKGVRFDNAFCPYPLCGPSRTSLLTGRRPESFPMPNNEVAWRDLRPSLKTLPEIAHANGYYTAGYGKIFHHGVQAKDLERWKAEHPGARLPHTYDDPPSWNESHSPKPEACDQHARGPEMVADGPPHGGTAMHTIRVTNPEVLCDVDSANRAVAFLENEAAQHDHFFLAVGFHKPHVPLIAPEKWWAYYDGLEVEKLVPPTWFQPTELPPETLKRPKVHRGLDEAQRRHCYQGYLACVSHMDEQLGRVLDTLEERGFANDTMIVFVADHGYHTGEQQQWDKMMLLDPAQRVPLIVQGPGIEPGAVPSQVESLDVFATICAQLGWDPGQEIHGADLSPWLRDPAAPSGRATFGWVQEGRRECWSIRTATHRYGVVDDRENGAAAYLIHHAADPHETANVINNPANAPLIAELDQQVRAHFADAAPVAALAQPS